METDLFSILDAHFAACDYWINEINGSKNIGVDIERMCSRMKTHITILDKILNGKLDPGKIIRGEYTNDELIGSSGK